MHVAHSQTEDVLKAWLLQRICGKNGSGDELVYATGELAVGRKYLPFRHREMSIERYLMGHREHLYGSWLARSDGQTRILAFDNDEDLSVLEVKRVMRQLVQAGAIPIYWARRPGRGHLELYFDALVQREAARLWAIGHAPVLENVGECYPLPGVGNALSWPLWFRVEWRVQASTAYYTFPWEPGAFYKLAYGPDDLTQRQLAMLVKACVTPASLVPPLPNPPIPDDQRKLIRLEQRKRSRQTSHSQVVAMWPSVKELISRFNAMYRLEDIHPLAKNRFALAVWRGERTPSVKYYPADNTWYDFGAHRAGDAFELACLVWGKSKSELLSELRREWQGGRHAA